MIDSEWEQASREHIEKHQPGRARRRERNTPMVAFKIGSPVPMSDVPVSTESSFRRGQFEEIFNLFGDLKRKEALPLTFTTGKALAAAKCALRKIAKREKEILSTSRSADQLTLYCWIEPKESVAATPIATKRSTKAA